jgi:hypothetical protein
MIHKDISTIQPKIKKMEEKRLLKLKTGIKNSEIPAVTYDKIEIAV